MRSYLLIASGLSLLPVIAEAIPGDALVKQVPAAAAVLVVVWLMLGFLKGERKSREQFFSDLQKEHLDARTESRKAIEDNTQALQQNAVASQRNNDLLDALIRERGPFHRQHD